MQTATKWKKRAKHDRKNREKIRRLQALELKLIETKDKMKTILKITLIIITLGLLSAWVFGIIDNERLLWIIGVISSSGVALWNWLLKEDYKRENKSLKIQNQLNYEHSKKRTSH
jgi:hypothetical protein